MGTPQQDQPLLVQRHGDRVILTLNRPDKLNAMNVEMIDQLHEALTAAHSDPAVECLIVTGAGSAFSAGHDFASIPAGDQGERIRFEAATIDLLEALPFPTIAAVHGYCVTGALELALACDIIVASEDAVFADTHGRYAMVPVWGLSVRLAERVGIGVARDMVYTGRRLGATDAMQVGLASRVLPSASFAEAVSAMADEVAANSAESNRITKLLFHNATVRSRDEALTDERALRFGLPSQ